MEERNNSGALFKNDKKDSDKHPDYKGSATVGGVEYWLSAWINTAATSGKKYMSLRLEPKQAQATNGNAQPEQPKRNPPRGTPPAQPSQDFDDDIPF
jgi:uncharacterized protein (DUF736 family)